MKNCMIRCPQCNSTEIYAAVGGYGGYYYRCKKCGYAGSLVIEYDSDEAPEEKRELQQEYQEEMQEYERKRRPLIWAVLALLFIAVVFLLVYR